jgi:hypothetical protein
MINLAFLNLPKLANEHHHALRLQVRKRFNNVKSYFQVVKALSGRGTNYPNGPLKAAAKSYLGSNNIAYLPHKSTFRFARLHDDIGKILNQLDKDFDLILKGQLSQINQLIIDIDVILGIYFDSTKDEYNPSIRPFLKTLEYIWNYRSFTQKNDDAKIYNAYRLAKKLDVNTCPYCNRLYTFTVTKPNAAGLKEHIRPEFDHFYSKSRYPFLALTFYNLVPCCHVCNSSLKGNQQMTTDTHCHPYLEGYDQVLQFRTGISIKAFLSNSNPPRKVGLEPVNGGNPDHLTRARETSKIFRINEIYPYHDDIVYDLFKKSTEESKRHVVGIWNEKSPHGNYLFKTKDELYRHFIGNYYSSGDFSKRPLAKLCKDILNETELTNHIHSLPIRPGDPTT